MSPGAEKPCETKSSIPPKKGVECFTRSLIFYAENDCSLPLSFR